MSKQTGAPSLVAARTAFSIATNFKKVLAQAIGEPTGCVVVLGGVEFDLVPLSTEDGEIVIEMVGQISTLWGRISDAANPVTQPEAMDVASHRFKDIVGIAKRVLKTSAGITEPGSEEDKNFDEWFGRLSFIATLKTLAPAVLRANGLGRLADRLENPPKPATQETPTPAEPVSD